MEALLHIVSQIFHRISAGPDGPGKKWEKHMEETIVSCNYGFDGEKERIINIS